MRLASPNPNEETERPRAGSPTVSGFQCLAESELGTFFIFSSPSSPSCLYISPRTPFAQELPEHLGHLSCIDCMACQQPTTTTAATAAHPPIKISGSTTTTGGGAPPARLSWANIALIGGVASCSAEALTYPLGTRPEPFSRGTSRPTPLTLPGSGYLR
jgi:hypothetical protein